MLCQQIHSLQVEEAVLKKQMLAHVAAMEKLELQEQGEGGEEGEEGEECDDTARPSTAGSTDTAARPP
eukprot:CAMPEP_0177667874 /NCGR_PEP_ID=MMETSP0447-20121125/22385_1 /TAXON_ID=0 /ORGANISM="Stygamoeba regulata, Strain BSH-02190019" /LENGTH=67 /DNA_ID=CAMNT_0019174193 /DNA_START=142 /DNA_END=345 /DNA_ORIENTATION=+